MMLIVALLLSISFNVTAQQNKSPGYSKTISGNITNVQGEPLDGVTITVKGKNISTSSDGIGKYSITIRDTGNVILIASTIGYITKNTWVSSSTKIVNIKLETTTFNLDQVVIVGYGSVKRKDVTGSISEVKMADLEKAPVATFDAALAGRVAGVNVSAIDGQPGSNNTITIRGGNSITQDNSPLYVVDGFPIEGLNINAVNPADIESIDVLKDASATAIYGARGANGVIIITTKKGKNGAPVITYNGWFGAQKNLKKQAVMNPYEFVKYQLELNPTSFTALYLNNGRTLDSYKDVQGIDWQDQILRNGQIYNHSISLRGGNDKTRYAVSGSTFDQQGIILGGGFNRVQGRIILDQTINNNLKTGINVNYSYSKSFGQVALATVNNVNLTSYLFYNAWGYRPTTGNATTDATFIDDTFDSDITSVNDSRINPYQSAVNNYNYNYNKSIYTNAYLEYKFYKYFTLRLTGGVTSTDLKNEIFNNSKSPAGNPLTTYGRTNGVNGSVINNSNVNLLNENTLTFNKAFNKNHILNIIGGFTVQKITLGQNGFAAIQVPNESLGINGLDEGTPTVDYSSASVSTLASFLGRVNYTFKSKYLFTASMRADGSSRFSPQNRWGYFPSGSFAWKLSEEKFMEKISFISDAKVRASYGITGNNRVTDYAYQSVLRQNAGANSGNTTGGYYFNNVYVPGAVPTDVGNDALKWESTAQANFGINLAFFKNRIEIIADYYDKRTKDLLLNASLPSSFGYLTGFKNIGTVSNRGLEFTLNTVNIQAKDFTWMSNFNISFNRNKIISLNDDQPSLTTRVSWNDNFNNSLPYIARPGQPVAMFYGFMFDGIYQYKDFDLLPNGAYTLKNNVVNNGLDRSLIQPGYIKYKDINGDGVVDANDQTVIGNPQPIHTGGFSNNFTYRNFDLNVFFQWSYGNDIMNANRIVFEGSGGTTYLNMFQSYQNRWTPDNQNNLLPKAGGYIPNVYSSRTIEDGSYLRLKTVALGYKLPASLLKKINIKSIRIYTSAQNLVTWTKYSGVDPEVSVRNSALTPGFDWSAYPKARTVTFGLDVTF
jgi:TonB-linked SusC/RagA family outer membrane protein